MDNKILSVTGLLAICAAVMPVTVIAAPRDASPRSQALLTYGLENPNVRRGYEAILAAIGLVPRATGQRAQYQAQIAYALDQALIDCPTTLAALDIVSRQPGFARATYGALRDVTTAASRCNGSSIAATDAGSAGELLSSGPGVGFGGGSSNYGQ